MYTFITISVLSIYHAIIILTNVIIHEIFVCVLTSFYIWTKNQKWFQLICFSFTCLIFRFSNFEITRMCETRQINCENRNTLHGNLALYLFGREPILENVTMQDQRKTLKCMTWKDGFYYHITMQKKRWVILDRLKVVKPIGKLARKI